MTGIRIIMEYRSIPEGPSSPTHGKSGFRDWSFKMRDASSQILRGKMHEAVMDW